MNHNRARTAGRYTPPQRHRSDVVADYFPLTAATGIPTVIPGGCDECDAEQRIEREERGMWHITVAHDDECPFLARRTATASAS
jgi:hypothetical protein